MQSPMTATIRIRINTNGLKAEAYLVKRGGDLLLNTYRRIYRDPFQAITHQLEAKSIISNFMADQLI
jgi:hypothetical protein